ncbi:kinesin KIF21A isoform X2 [Micractinium conductrix]|uniref:Kinesin KIF21A isoform X2 n=1 Tax=Micractinium conductrix TaxID=554055 RepID=A0A2P6V7Q5_9CHLO|nr:kinesin KIF21A isoform X2 [Micractinium conductrix]|eukprot:PSC70110.1 kinesin KIF21A isoform X2 [Micractinium conductrix]
MAGMLRAVLVGAAEALAKPSFCRPTGLRAASGERRAAAAAAGATGGEEEAEEEEEGDEEEEGWQEEEDGDSDENEETRQMAAELATRLAASQRLDGRERRKASIKSQHEEWLQSLHCSNLWRRP